MKLAFIGCGNMARAMMGGAIRGGFCGADEIVASGPHEPALARARREFGIRTTRSNAEAAGGAETVVLSVKPQVCGTVIHEIAGAVREDALAVSIAPGKTLAWLGKAFGRPVHLVRAMPNTPAMVGAGMTAVCPGAGVTPEEKDRALRLFSSFGRAELLPERLMDAAVSVGGSSPALVFILIEAMADAAVADGMPRAQAYTFAAQAVLGSAKMVLETGRHPAELKDAVCSPAGTTIEAVRVLEKAGFRSSVFEALQACTRRAKSV